MSIKLSTTRQEAVSNGVKMLVYGDAGIGKTSLAKTAPDHNKVIILSAESGLLSLADTDIAVFKVEEMQDLLDAYNWLTTTEQGLSYDWLILDSLSEMTEVVLAAEKLKAGRDKRAAYVPMQEIIESMIKNFRDLPKNVCMTCKLESYQDDSKMVIKRPKLVGQQLPVNIPYLFDEVFYMHSGTDADGQEYRALQTQPDRRTVAKDRSGKLDLYEYPSLAHIAEKILNNTTQTNQEA